MDRLGRALLLAPVVFVAHVVEESHGFVPWFNGHVGRGITPDLFWSVNLGGLVITLLALGVFFAARSAASATLVLGWLACLMLANGVFHIAGAIVDRGYVPGVITAVLLYLPYFAWISRELIVRRLAPTAVLAAGSVVGAIPMLVHGYLILFRGSRLF